MFRNHVPNQHRQRSYVLTTLTRKQNVYPTNCLNNDNERRESIGAYATYDWYRRPSRFNRMTSYRPMLGAISTQVPRRPTPTTVTLLPVSRHQKFLSLETCGSTWKGRPLQNAAICSGYLSPTGFARPRPLLHASFR